MNELDLFAAVIAIAELGERAALLERECAGRPDLRNRIDQLVSAHFKSNALLDVPETDSSRPLTRCAIGRTSRNYSTSRGKSLPPSRSNDPNRSHEN